MRGILAAVALVAAASSPSTAATKFILCQSQDIEDVVIELDAAAFEGRSMACIRGGNGFYADMTPCAPDGAFALSAPTGAAAIVAIVDRWQDYGDHLGGVVSFGASEINYWFQGGFMSQEMGYEEKWTFEVSRLTGDGELTLFLPDDDSDELVPSTKAFACVPASQKF